MNTQVQSFATLLILATITVASCDPSLAPETTANPATNPGTASDSEATSADGFNQFRLNIVPTDIGALAMSDKFHIAATRWQEVVRDTDLPDVQVEAGQAFRCAGLVYQSQSEVLDDLTVLVSVRDIDGEGRIAAASTVCVLRELSFLPLLAAVFLDRADIAELSREDVQEVILHELGHTLGIGTIWVHTGYLALASLFSPGADTHFLGDHAVAAFDSAGGTGYAGAKVPVENSMGYGAADTHWRESVLGLELMTPVLQTGRVNPFSAITIESLVDLGYTVDASLADEYELTEAGSDLAAPGDRPAGAPIDLSGDIRRGTLTVVDNDGRVVRRIVPR